MAFLHRKPNKTREAAAWQLAVPSVRVACEGVTILQRVPAPRKDFHLAEMDGESLLYCHEKMTMVYLNESAAVIWRLCDGQRTVGQIVDVLKSAYPSLSHQIDADVCDTIQQFVRYSMLDGTET